METDRIVSDVIVAH